VFDNQMLAQIFWHKLQHRRGELPYEIFQEASSIQPQPQLKYGFGCLSTGLTFRLCKMGLMTSKLFPSRLKQRRALATPALRQIHADDFPCVAGVHVRLAKRMRPENRRRDPCWSAQSSGAA